MSRPLNTIVLTLLEAVVTLYPANADGSPQLSSPLWLGVKTNGLAVRDRWITVETRPTGATRSCRNLRFPWSGSGRCRSPNYRASFPPARNTCWTSSGARKIHRTGIAKCITA